MDLEANREPRAQAATGDHILIAVPPSEHIDLDLDYDEPSRLGDETSPSFKAQAPAPVSENDNQQHHTLPDSLQSSLARFKIHPIRHASDLLFFASQTSQILVPATVCATFGAALVRFRDVHNGVFPDPNAPKETPQQENKKEDSGSLPDWFPIVFVGVLVVQTIALMLLFKYNFRRTLYLIFGISGILCIAIGVLQAVVLIPDSLGFDANYKSTEFNFDLQSVTMGVAVLAYGLYTASRHGMTTTMHVTLGFMSSMYGVRIAQYGKNIAVILLGVLVIWDIVAVMLPFGPLRVLVNSAQEHNIALDMLLYKLDDGIDDGDEDPTDATAVQSATNVLESTATSAIVVSSSASLKSSSVAASASAISTNNTETSQQVQRGNRNSQVIETGSHVSEEKDKEETVSHYGTRCSEERELNTECGGGGVGLGQAPELASGPKEENENEKDKEKAAAAGTSGALGRRNGLSLGLGDLVFYTTLCVVASEISAPTFFICLVTAVTGLAATIMLLAVMGRILPALPISLTAGIALLYASEYATTPLLHFLSELQIFF